MSLHARMAAALESGRLRLAHLSYTSPSTPAQHDAAGVARRIRIDCGLEPDVLGRLVDDKPDIATKSQLLGMQDYCSWILSLSAGFITHIVVIPLLGQQVMQLLDGEPRQPLLVALTSPEEADGGDVVEVEVKLTALDAALLRQHWRERPPATAADRVLQTLDILLYETAADGVPVGSLALFVPPELQAMLLEPMASDN